MVASDLDKVRVEATRVPGLENRAQLVRREPRTVFHKVIGLTDKLHVAVFDAVMDHLDEMSGTVLPDVVATGLTVVTCAAML